MFAKESLGEGPDGFASVRAEVVNNRQPFVVATGRKARDEAKARLEMFIILRNMDQETK